jgi:hypothetical protein
MRSSLVVLILVTCGALGTAGAAVSRSNNFDACSLISKSQIESVLGLQSVMIEKDVVGTSSPGNTSGAVHSACFGVAWSGAPSTTPAGARQKLADGTGAAFAVESWAPDKASKYVRKWNTSGFTALMLTAAKGSVFGDLPAFQPLNLKPLVSQGRAAGADRAAGLTATPLGVSTVRAAAGTWWNTTSHTALSIAFEGSAKNPTVKQLNQLAKIGAAKFGLKPLVLG